MKLGTKSETMTNTVSIEARKLEILARFDVLKAKAVAKFGDRAIPNHLKFDFSLRGTTAGMACMRRSINPIDGFFGTIKLNKDMIANGSYDHILNETLPHELAHIICMNLNIGKGHDNTWKAVAQFLGCKGNRCHSEPVVYAKGVTYLYTCTRGTQVAMSQIKHKRIQFEGMTYITRAGGKLHKECAYTRMSKAA